MTMEIPESQRTSPIRGKFPPDELNLFDYLRVLSKHRWMIGLVCLATALAVGLVSFLSPPVFVATASVVPPMQTMGGNPGLEMGLLGGGGGSSLLRKVMDVSSVVDMYVGILQSRAATDAIVDRFDLVHAYEVGGSRHRARTRLRGSTSFSVSDDGILYLTVEDTDPNRAAEIANAYIEQLDHLNKKLSAGQSTSKRIFLETRLKDMEANLGRQDIPSREEQVQEVLYELLMRELEIAKIEEAKSMPTIQILDPAVPPERRKARRTVVKATLSAIIAFVCMVFVAFGREYAREYREQEAMQRLPVLGASMQPAEATRRDDHTRPVWAVRRKRIQAGEQPVESANPVQHV
jgi:uncharacterized protein involved in exopolysaccharide biosynthesis